MGWDTSKVEANLRRFMAQAERNAAAGAADCAQELLARSSALCPVEEGTLLRSGRVMTGEDGAAVGYGSGGAEAYAVPQHERLDYRHEGRGQAKFLETPHRQMGNDGTYLRIIGRRVQGGMS